MCRVYDCEPGWWHERWQRARKPHRCAECRREIAVGERYVVQVSRYDGLYSQKCCAQCQALGQVLANHCGGFLLTEVVADVEEHAREYGSRGLMRLVVTARRGWTHRGATKLPWAVVLEAEGAWPL